ncbi:MAG TPA: NADH:ubiquinone oxidoreductase subunit NDUFA12 [Rhodobacteraceae bacterium]|nr:NADH:ubiquinone oxidoreductase subunit NDUFA12 [Paracoccaceae bacterium]
MKFILSLLTWWNGQTLGTRIFTWRHGQFVGKDDLGNKYYENGARRWVIYNGPIEGSRVPAAWHGWLHHTFDNRPGNNPLPEHSWQKPSAPNPTGTPQAYHPKGSLVTGGEARADYEAWQPE